MLPRDYPGDDTAETQTQSSENTSNQPVIANEDMTLVSNHFENNVMIDATEALTITVPQGITTAGIITITKLTDGVVTLGAGAGVVINSINGFLTIGEQFSSVTLRRLSDDVYLLQGNLVANIL